MDTPFPEAYWVEPGFLLAGPYPAPRWAHITNDKLQKLLQAGIQLFVDLTEKGEALPYADKLGGKRVTCGCLSPISTHHPQARWRRFSTPWIARCDNNSASTSIAWRDWDGREPSSAVTRHGMGWKGQRR
jgi:hypothetical protein